jgi:hypothetical protein
MFSCPTTDIEDAADEATVVGKLKERGLRPADVPRRRAGAI